MVTINGGVVRCESAAQSWNANLFTRWITWQGCDAKAGRYKNRPVSKCFFSFFPFLSFAFISHCFGARHKYMFARKLKPPPQKSQGDSDLWNRAKSYSRGEKATTYFKCWLKMLGILKVEKHSPIREGHMERSTHPRFVRCIILAANILRCSCVYRFHLATFLCHACGSQCLVPPYWPGPCLWWKRAAKRWRRVPRGLRGSGWPLGPSDPACEQDAAHCSLTAVDSGEKRKRLIVEW